MPALIPLIAGVRLAGIEQRKRFVYRALTVALGQDREITLEGGVIETFAGEDLFSKFEDVR